ncbi:MAG: magnesium transporter [Lewinellaceae bacterium]|nr:magnesium transporter [Phaeodactylibacter sp.]MCB9041791.1 magnesium transporter [Lewinellaceae bacterium]
MENNGLKAKQSLIKGYFQQFPTEAALVLDTFPADKILDYLSSVPAGTAKEVFSRLNPDVASEVMEEMEDQLFIQLFSNIDTHLGARLLSRLDKKEIQQKLALLPGLLSREMQEFLSYQPDSAGYLMETTVTTFNVENTVQDVLERIRKLRDRRITTVFVINESGNLLGKVTLQLIAISQPEEKLSMLMQAAPAVNAMSSQEEVLEIMEKEKMFQVPVTDINNHLLGVIRNDALIDATKREVTEDLQAMFGAGREERALSKVSFAVRKRLPWLQINLATAFLASMVVGLFEDTIAKITILAVFLPVVAGQSGNTGSQALAVTMRGLALREIRISQWFKVAKKEIMVGFINGLAVSFTTGIIVYFWASSFGIALVIAISMVLSMMIAGFSGAGIPMALKALGQDPATSSSIILTTVTDICGFLSFLGLATALATVLGIT